MTTLLFTVSADMLAAFSPATGDASRPWLWLVIAGAAVVVAAVLSVTMKKSRRGDCDDDGDDDAEDK